MRFTKDMLIEYERLRNSSDYSDKLKAAAMDKDWEKDTEMAEKLRALSAQLAFAGPNADDDDAVVQTRAELAALIQARAPFAKKIYHRYLFDEDILDCSSGAVTSADDEDCYTLTFMKNSVHDPNIFGGNGRIPMMEDGEHSCNPYSKEEGSGLAVGHIELPMYCINYRDIKEICNLTGLTESQMGEILTGKAWLDTVDKRFYPFPMVADHWRAPNILGYGDSIRYLLENTGLPDHPERYTFRILPVLCGAVRHCYMTGDGLTIHKSSIDDGYNRVLNRIKRVNKLMDVNAPPVIMMNELRMLQEHVGLLLDSTVMSVPPERRPDSICDALKDHSAKKSRPWVRHALLFGLRMRSCGFEIPILKDRNIDITPHPQLLVDATLTGDPDKTTIPVTEAIETLRIVMTGIEDHMWDTEKQLNELPEDDAKRPELENEIQRLESDYQRYGNRVNRMQQLAMTMQPVTLELDADGIIIPSDLVAEEKEGKEPEPDTVYSAMDVNTAETGDEPAPVPQTDENQSDAQT